MIKVEACINSDTILNVQKSVSAAYSGGASTVELCGEMHYDGLTPPMDHIVEARKAFPVRKGLMVMIRPRAGDFLYTNDEIRIMQRQIHTASEAGADGVVFGTLQRNGAQPAIDPLMKLIETAFTCGLKVTFHRAFDALSKPLESLELLIDSGVHRVLTSGTPWGHNSSALDGIIKLQELIEHSKGRIEIVVSGGINLSNVVTILNRLPLESGNVSVHAFSGVQENGITTAKAVKLLVDAVNVL